MDDLDEFRFYYELAEQLISGASKDGVVEAARIQAMNLANYQLKYDELPMENVADRLRTGAVDDKTADLLSTSTQNLVAALAQAMGLADDSPGDELH